MVEGGESGRGAVGEQMAGGGLSDYNHATLLFGATITSSQPPTLKKTHRKEEEEEKNRKKEVHIASKRLSATFRF